MVVHLVGKNLCRFYHLTFTRVNFGDTITCGYLNEIPRYLEKFQERCPIYFDHKMATFNSTVPMTLVLGIVWYPNNEASETHQMVRDIPIFTGPLIKNPNNVKFSNDELLTMITDFGSGKTFNYYFFDRFIKPPYKLENEVEKSEYIKNYNNCEKIGKDQCSCLPTCQWIGEKGGEKGTIRKI